MPRSVPLAAVALSATVCAVVAYASLPQQAPVKQAPMPTPSPTPSALPPPILTVPDAPKDSQAVVIEKADILVQAVGPLMKTTLTLRFRNKTDRILEGELAFPLPEGAALCGYALDINGDIADAVPVPKEEARVVFETEARKGVDPGLIEQTQGNNFRTRIYPLPPQKTRTVRLSFVSEATESKNGESRMSLPLRWNQTIPLFSVTIASDAPTTLAVGGKERDSVREETTGSLTKTLENVVINGDMNVRVRTDQSQTLRDGVMTETFTKPNGVAETYFAVLEQTPAPTGDAAVVRPGRTIGLLWDASLSRRSAKIERELRFLEALAREKWRDVTVQVTVLRDTPVAGRSFAIRDGDASELIAYLREQPLDGGTRLSGASFAAPETPFAYQLAFTDGLDTLTNDGQVAFTGPTWIINSDSRSDANRLRSAATKCGGDYLFLDDDAPNAERVKAIGESPYSLLSATVDDGKVDGLTANGVSPVKTANSIALAGRLVSDAATITLRYGYPGGPPTATRTVTIRKPEADAPSSGLVGYVWAQRTADALSIEPKRNRDALRRIGQEFSIVTPGTSLLVLETLDQCLQYGIAPARTRKALYAQYIKTVETQGVARREEQKSRIDEAVSRWKDRLSWWSREFQPGANFRYKEKQSQTASGRAAAPRPVGHAALAVARRVDGANEEVVSEPQQMRARSNAARRTGYSAYAGVAAGSGAGADIQTTRIGAREASSDRLASHIPADRAKQADDFMAKPSAFPKPSTVEPSITIKPWTPNAPYIKKMANAKTAEQAYAVYIAERKAWLETPAYYFDCAEELHRRGADALAVRVLTGIADLRQEDAALLRIVAHRLVQWGHVTEAIPIFETVADLRPEEPQSFRDLALALADRGDALARTQPAQAVPLYNRALQRLNKVAVNRWDRFEGISDIAVTEANRILARAKRLPGDASAKLVVPLDSRLVRNIESDLRIVMTWDSDNTDMDLHVIEPSGEECFYSHNRTAIGGRLSDDFTQGYGPEEYFVRRNRGGKYEIRTNYYGSREQKITGGTTVQATVYTDWGRPTEKRQSLSLRLTKDNETVTIGSVTVARGAK